MDKDDAPLRSMLAGKGIKSTKQRLAVLGVLEKSEGPLTAEEIFLRSLDSCPGMSLSTVYRVLDTLCGKDVATRSGLMEGGRALFEVTPVMHRHNLICVRCHSITQLDDCPLSEYESDIARRTGYNISGHKLEVYGICPKCRKNQGR